MLFHEISKAELWPGVPQSEITRQHAKLELGSGSAFHFEDALSTIKMELFLVVNSIVKSITNSDCVWQEHIQHARLIKCNFGLVGAFGKPHCMLT